MFAIDPLSPSTPFEFSLSPSVAHLVDLVFASTGELYAVENNERTARILRISRPDGDRPPGAYHAARPRRRDRDRRGRRSPARREPDRSRLPAARGVARLDPGDREGARGSPGPKTIEIDDGYFPTGIVYDRLGTVVYHRGNTNTRIDAVSVSP
jgi:hypothetical protein